MIGDPMRREESVIVVVDVVLALAIVGDRKELTTHLFLAAFVSVGQSGDVVFGCFRWVNSLVGIKVKLFPRCEID